MITLLNSFGSSKELVFVDFDTRKSLTLKKIRNFHTVNNSPIAVKVTSLFLIERSFFNKGSTTQCEDIFRVLDAEQVEIFAEKYEQWYTPEYDEIDFEFGLAKCINLSVNDCLTIGGNFIFKKNDINESGRVKGVVDLKEPVKLYFLDKEEKKSANLLLDKRLNSIKDAFIKYDLNIKTFHSITNNIYL